MNILVIGNGFDLAHGLATKYGDFLEYIKLFKQYDSDTALRDGLSIKECSINMEYFNILDTERPELYENLKYCITDNLWLNYFCGIYESRIKEGKDGWIDFEKEISEIIQVCDRINIGIKSSDYEWGTILTNEEKHVIDSIYPLNGLSGNVIDRSTVVEIKERLLDDMNKLIRGLEIYLCSFLDKAEKKLSCIKGLHIDKVLSFNYTNTYQKLYGTWVEHDYIHGRARLENNIRENNMVLGIDEYLEDESRNTDLDFIEFKKYFQRIRKKTGRKYRNWIDDIKHPNENTKTDITHNIYFFGHSLDITDKDVLRDFLLLDNVNITIFYMDNNDYKQKIINIIRLIGQYELIKRTGGNDMTIKFVRIS